MNLYKKYLVTLLFMNRNNYFRAVSIIDITEFNYGASTVTGLNWSSWFSIPCLIALYPLKSIRSYLVMRGTSFRKSFYLLCAPALGFMNASQHIALFNHAHLQKFGIIDSKRMYEVSNIFDWVRWGHPPLRPRSFFQFNEGLSWYFVHARIRPILG